jgi:hypothetical protein
MWDFTKRRTFDLKVERENLNRVRGEKWPEYLRLERVGATGDAGSVRAHIDLIDQEIAAINAELRRRREGRRAK